jgi:hypothetical protein
MISGLWLGRGPRSLFLMQCRTGQGVLTQCIYCDTDRMDTRISAEQAIEEIWSILCPDCGPQDYENIVIAVWNVANPTQRKQFVRRSGPMLVK